MSATMTADDWMQRFYTQGLLLLREIPETSSDDIQMTLDKTSPDIADCTRLTECSDTSSAVDVKTCLQLLQQIFYRAVLALTRNQYQLHSVLLRTATLAESSEVSVSLDSLISSVEEKTRQSGSYTCSNTGLQLSRFDDDDDCLSAKLSPVNTAKENDVSAKASAKRKTITVEGSQTGAIDCSDSKENDSCKSVHSRSQAASFSSLNSSTSKDSSCQLTVNDEMRLSNGQLHCGVKRYELRKRTHRDLNSGSQTEVAGSNEDKKMHRMVTDDGTAADQNQTTHVRLKRNSTLTPDHCLVLKQPLCCICGLSFSTTAECLMHCRRDHIITDHLGNTKPHLACRECPVRFAVPAIRVDSDLHIGIRVAQWFSHAVRVHNFTIPSAIETFVCSEPECRFVALTPASFQTHRQKNRHGGVTALGTSALVYFELRCFLCSTAEEGREIFPSKAALREHITQKHVQRDRDREVLLCPVCKAERPLTRARVDVGDRCRPSSCQRFFYVVYCLLRHLVSKHRWSIPEYIQSFPCKFPGCRYIGVARCDLESHCISHDSAGGSNRSRNPSVPCEKCGKLIKLRAMRSHLRLCQVSLVDRRTQLCPYCNTRLSSQHSLHYHVKAMHSGSNASKQFLCSYCTYSCHHKSNLEEHIFHRHGSNVSRRSVVACSLCPFRTIKQAALRRHVSLVHSDAKTFRCPVCDKMFKCQLHLKNHMVSHNERRFACPSCSYRAARKANLEVHILAQHSSNRKSFRCNEPCPYVTGYAANLSKHQRLFCKYRRQYSNLSSIKSSGTVVVPNITPQLENENEAATGCNAVSGISKAIVMVASSWRV